MEPAPFTAVARVVKTHGVDGELSCTPLEGPLDELDLGTEVWFVPPPGAPLATRIEGVRPGPKGDLLKLAGVNSTERARELTSTLLLVRTSDLPEGWMPEEEPDPVGMTVRDETRGDLGRISDVIVTGANDVWVVVGEKFGEVLIPVIDDVILEIDEDARVAEVRLLPGLIDED